MFRKKPEVKKESKQIGSDFEIEEVEEGNELSISVYIFLG